MAGREQRLEYTAIGDTINTASRIEGMTKGTPDALFLADSTRVEEILRLHGQRRDGGARPQGRDQALVAPGHAVLKPDWQAEVAKKEPAAEVEPAVA